ncbi:MAG: ATP-binding protein [Gemmatimonadota bacterium]
MHRRPSPQALGGASDVAGGTRGHHEMTDTTLDTVALGLALASGLPLVGILLAIRQPNRLAATPARQRWLARALFVIGGGNLVVAILRLAQPSVGGAANAALGLALAAMTVALGASLSRWLVPVAPSAPDPRAEADVVTPSASDASATRSPSVEPVDATVSLPVGESRLSGLLFEGSADAIGSPLPTDLAEFDARLMHANRMQSIGRLAGGIAHDFNNLLTSILTSAEMAQEALPAEHGVTPDLLEIRRAGTRASELTRQLLAFARRDVSRPRVVDANALVGNLATMLRRLLGETIVLKISLASELPLLLADPAQLEQVIVNLAVNARDAMVGGGDLQLRTSRGFPAGRGDADDVKSGVVIEVQDSGIGMSAEVRERLFEPFFTTKHPGRGTGLGLATCHAIVVAHGGEIEVDSHPNVGSTFRVWLPATDEHDDPRAAGGLSSTRAVAGGAQQSILVVEDDAAVRASTVRALRRAGYEVVEAADGEEALTLMASREVEVDLVVSDIVMPRMGGAAFVRALTQRWPRVRVLFVSGYPGDSPDVRAVEEMAIPVLEKPYTPSILLFEVRLLLDTARTS